MRALVIDDSRAMRTILGGLMAQLGFQVLEAQNGKEALDTLRAKGAPDVALVDWNMPELNGLDFIKAVRQERAWDTTKLVVVSTETERSQMLRALEAGANEYVMKPFTREVVAEKLRMLGVVS